MIISYINTITITMLSTIEMSKINILEIQPIKQSEWLECCINCNYSTFFQTPYWVNLFNKCTINVYQITFTDYKKAVLPLPFIRTAKGILKVYQSMPAGTFGGWISTDQLGPEHTGLLLDYLMSLSDLQFRENPYDPFLKNIEIPDSAEDFTSTIRLPETYDIFFEQSDSAHRKAFRKAQKAGIDVKMASDFEEWEQYYNLYLQSISRWKDKNIYSGTFYDLTFLRKIFSLPVHLRTLWIATYQSQPISGIICFYWNKHAVAWHGAGNSDFFSMRPNNLLYDTAIHDAIVNKYEWFDCNPSGGLEGVIQFKRFLGAIELRSRFITKKSASYRFVEFIRNFLDKN